MEFDVVIVGAGPSGLSAACRIKQQAAAMGQDVDPAQEAALDDLAAQAQELGMGY